MQRLTVFLSTKMTDRRQRAWALEAVREHELNYRVQMFQTPGPADVYVYSCDVTRLTGPTRVGVEAYTRLGSTTHPPGRPPVIQSPEVHVTCGPKITLPKLTRELHQATAGPDFYYQDPRMNWQRVLQVGANTVLVLEQRR